MQWEVQTGVRSSGVWNPGELGYGLKAQGSWKGHFGREHFYLKKV